MIIQDPTDDHNVHIFGAEAKLISQQNGKQLKEKFGDFHIEFHDDEWPTHTQRMAGIVKKKSPMRSVWQSGDTNVRCELLVFADEMKGSNPVNGSAVYAVVPAHLIFENHPFAPHVDRCQMQPTNESYFYDLPTHDITHSREEAEQKTTRTRYTIESPQLDEMLSLPDCDLSHPPLFAYRQSLAIKTELIAKNERNRLMRCQGVKVRSCPTETCQKLSESECHHLYMNDLAMLYVSTTDNREFVNMMKVVTRYTSPFPMRRHKRIETMDEVDQLCRRRVKIAIGDCRGRLCTAPISQMYSTSVKEDPAQLAIRLPFVLTRQTRYACNHYNYSLWLFSNNKCYIKLS